jgi:hypothetical protein
MTSIDAAAVQDRIDRNKKAKERFVTLTEEQLAESFVSRMYGEDQNEASDAFAKKLAAFTKEELLVLNEVVDLVQEAEQRRREFEAMTESIRNALR